MSAIPAGGRPFPHPIEADTVEQFLALLRVILAWSGRTAGQISTYAGKTQLPRSTAYRFASMRNKGLPKERRQVELFVQGCGLAEDQVDRVLALWEAISAEPILAEEPIAVKRWAVDHARADDSARIERNVPATEVLDAEVVDIVTKEIVRREAPGQGMPRPEVSAVIARVLHEDTEAGELADALIDRLFSRPEVREIVVHHKVSVHGDVHGNLHVTVNNAEADRRSTGAQWFRLAERVLRDRHVALNLVILMVTAMAGLGVVGFLFIQLVELNGPVAVGSLGALLAGASVGTVYGRRRRRRRAD